MIIIISLFFLIACACGIFVAMRTKKPFKQIMTEIKYEIHYNVIGLNGLMDDFMGITHNKTDMPNKSGKIAVITGGARGIGVEVVKMLLQCDMHVVIGCRNVEAGEKIEFLARKDGILTGSTSVYKLDVASLKSVREFGKIVAEKYPKIDVLINNAGIMFGPFVETEDGFESQFQVNYLGHFLLTHLLLPNLEAAGDEECKARIVNVSSCAHLAGEIDFDDINMKKEYISAAAYGQSKLAQVLFTVYLDNKMKTEGKLVQAQAVHPGIVNTDLFNGTPIKKFAPFLPGLIFKTPVKGAIPIVYCAISTQLEGRGGCYISNCRRKPTNPLVCSKELQEKLFNLSNKLCGIEEFGKP